MKLAHPFYRLPLHFDVARLQAEVAQFADDEWQRHPTGYAGNSAIRLISVEGDENDLTVGRMAPAKALNRCLYIRQILEHFGVVWSRSRLMRLAPGAVVPEHSDINYHWHHRVRIHIPVATAPGVRFECGGDAVHMAAGEAWLFDNWRNHAVHNDTGITRIHLVADTAGSAAFWEGVAASQHRDFDQPSSMRPSTLAYRPGHEPKLLFERHNSAVVLPPAEIEQLVGDLASDLETPAGPDGTRAVETFRALLAGFCREWRLGWSLHGDEPEGWPNYARLRDYLDDATVRLPPIRCASNGTNARKVLEARVLMYALNPSLASAAGERDRTLGPAESPAETSTVRPDTGQPAAAAKVRTTAKVASRIDRPVFIVAAPRSGSTLLFETLAEARDLVTVGGEAHWLVEGLPQLKPGAPGVDSNRLTASQLDSAIASDIERSLLRELRDRDAVPAPVGGHLRVLEKTPKNALRIPFFDGIFPDARFVFLWREPRGNIASIIEAWRAGKWQTYGELPGRSAPWSLLLPPGWQQFGEDALLEEIAAFQWAETNRIVLDDLAALPRERWTHLSYADFLADPAAQTQRLCGFAGIAFDPRLAARTEAALPLSVHTNTPPDKDKWKRNAGIIERVLPRIEPVLARLQALGDF